MQIEQQQSVSSSQNPSPRRRRFFIWVTCLFMLYMSAGLLFFMFQEKLLFHPSPLPGDYEFSFSHPFKEVTIAMSPRDTVHMVQFQLPDTALRKGIVLYFHGNGGNVVQFAPTADIFLKNGYEVWMPDYPGYGKSRGALSEKMILAEATEVCKLVLSQVESDELIVYGRSLGSGPATYIAATQKTKRLILETPFYSIPSLFQSYAPVYPMSLLSKYRFPNGENLLRVHEPVTIFHGTADRVVFYRNSTRLQQHLKPDDQFITIPGGGHNNLSESPRYQQVMDSLLSAP